MLAGKCHVVQEELGLAAKSKKKWLSFHCFILFIPCAVNECLFQLNSFVKFTHAYYEYRKYKSYLPVQCFPPPCSAPSSNITISSRRKILGGQTYRSYVIVERDWFPQFDQCHVIVGHRRWRVMIRMCEDLVNWDNLLGSACFTKIMFTCYTDKRVVRKQI